MSKIVDKRYEFVLFFDVENGNPNGDPDAIAPRAGAQVEIGPLKDIRCTNVSLPAYEREFQSSSTDRGNHTPWDFCLASRRCTSRPADCAWSSRRAWDLRLPRTDSSRLCGHVD